MTKRTKDSKINGKETAASAKKAVSEIPVADRTDAQQLKMLNIYNNVLGKPPVKTWTGKRSALDKQVKKLGQALIARQNKEKLGNSDMVVVRKGGLKAFDADKTDAKKSDTSKYKDQLKQLNAQVKKLKATKAVQNYIKAAALINKLKAKIG